MNHKNNLFRLPWPIGVSYSACPLLTMTLWAEPMLTWNDGSSCTSIILRRVLTIARGFYAPCDSLVGQHIIATCVLQTTPTVPCTTLCAIFISIQELCFSFVDMCYLCVCVCSSDPCWLLPERCYTDTIHPKTVSKLRSVQIVTLQPFFAFDISVATTFYLTHIVVTYSNLDECI